MRGCNGRHLGSGDAAKASERGAGKIEQTRVLESQLSDTVEQLGHGRRCGRMLQIPAQPFVAFDEARFLHDVEASPSCDESIHCGIEL